MPASVFYDLVKVSSSTVGTGPLTIGQALAGFLNFTTGGVSSGDTLSYTIFDGLAPRFGLIDSSETGQGIATLSNGVWSLSRDTVRKSTNDNMAISCSGREIVALVLAAEDILFTPIQLGSLMSAWLATLPTSPQVTPQWWNNGGSPAFS